MIYGDCDLDESKEVWQEEGREEIEAKIAENF
jgi:hypothetical protein